MKNLAELFLRTVERQPDKIGLTYGDCHLPWREVYARAALLSERLRLAGIRRGDVVAVYAEHAPAQVVGLLGVTMIGAVFTVINTLLKTAQITHQITDASVKAVVGTAAFVRPLQSLWEQRQLHVVTMTADGTLIETTTPATSKSPTSMPVPATIPTDVANIIYTSGSTGRAKGVVIPQRTLLDGARIVSQYLHITERDVLLSLLPFSFDYGLNQLLTALYCGARLVFHTFTFPQDLVDVLVREQVTGLAGVPSLWPHLFNRRLLDPAAKPTFAHLRYLTTAGGVHSRELLTQLVAFFPLTEIIIMYGLTESFRSTYLPFSELFTRPGSIGKAVPEVEILVRRDDGTWCQPGERGELVHRGAFVSYGYLNDPDLTERKFIELQTGGPGCLPERAVRSGDIVSMDDDGYLYFHGRADMQIKSSGYRISPGEVEEAVLRFPDISHAAAFALPDSALGESLHLAYATASGQPVDHAQLLRHLTDLLPAYALPRHIRSYAALPLTPNGKIDYPALRHDAERERAGDA